MNRPVAHKTRRYTLVEILVAMAILVIMMSFLFQFVIGAQRIWSASTRTASVFDKAQIVFDVIETDLKNAIVSDDPGRELPLYLARTINLTDAPEGEHITDLYLGMVSQTESRGEEEGTPPLETYIRAYPILYYFNRADYKMYRVAVDDDSFENAAGDSKPVNPWSFFGADFGTYDFMPLFLSYNDVSKSNPFYFDDNKSVLDVIADNVLEINVQFHPSATGYITSRPTVAKITLTLFDPMAIPNFENLPDSTVTEKEEKEEKIVEVSRVFTKLVFLK
jgi:type II secretory pathway pseudopilin PulG